MIVKLGMLIVFFGVMVGIGLYCRRHATDVNGFVLGGRSVGPWLTAFAYGTSYFSAVVFVGYAGQFGWKYGIAATWAGIGNALLGSLLAWAVLGRRTRIMTQHLGLRHHAGVLRQALRQSKSLKIAASVIIFIFLIPYTASLYNGLSRLFGMAFNIDYSVCVIVMAVLTGVYVIAGGYMATAINDFIQGIIMIVGIVRRHRRRPQQPGRLYGRPGGTGPGERPRRLRHPRRLRLLLRPRPPEPAGRGAAHLAWAPGACPRWSRSSTPSGTRRPSRRAPSFPPSSPCSWPAAATSWAASGGSSPTRSTWRPTAYDSIIPTMLSGLSDVLIAVVVILVLSASMSTLSSLVLASSSTLTLDFLKDHFIKDMDEKRQVRIIRGLIVVFIAISVVLAIIQYRSSVTFIAQLMGVSWGALAGAFLAPFLYGLYWKKATSAACWASFLFSTVVMLANIFVGSRFPALLQSPINAGAFCMLAGLVIVPVVSLFTRKPDPVLVEDAFSCYNKPVIVAQREALGD